MAPRHWTLWRQRPRVVVYCLLTEAVAVALTLRPYPVAVDRRTLLILATLLLLGILQSETGRRVERIRRRVSGTPHINMTSVWTFAGVLLLPPPLLALLVAGLYSHLALRSWYRLQRVPASRTASNAAIILLSCYAAQAVVPDIRTALTHGWAGTFALAAAGVTFFVVNALLVLPARHEIGRTPEALFGTWADNGLEVATLCLGALNALALATLPGLVLLVLPPLLLLHRTVLVKQLEVAAHRDEKTGLYNTSGWHALAERTLAATARQRSTFGLLMLDLDHFKQVNDTYGHLAGDAVLRAVAQAIISAVRGRGDAVGRFGGEEFVVLLPGISEPDIGAVAERIRRAVSTLTVPVGQLSITGQSVSIGSAVYPRAGTSLQRLLDAADTALYHAKATGRNKVVHVADLK
ncbi:GGDEF domain-containing protein [Amycolatopsis sp. SID8362]|uniref:GGDEF domain-containing protein n=1 Tax=Amycolatopsis sp. SID8362 TaxID=2690346 RepID=UPI00136D285F|nr:GGDEF domain-containing protein [Amycolatopsis sp. SID8362]NBH06663.1 diguanylate cyclase [Amycolatopsis sp. SID8362]NED43360.1 GGDEF domain-containing protein [Amycolatopsis sp. SID8362]